MSASAKHHLNCVKLHVGTTCNLTSIWLISFIVRGKYIFCSNIASEVFVCFGLWSLTMNWPDYFQISLNHHDTPNCYKVQLYAESI